MFTKGPPLNFSIPHPVGRGPKTQIPHVLSDILGPFAWPRSSLRTSHLHVLRLITQPGSLEVFRLDPVKIVREYGFLRISTIRGIG